MYICKFTVREETHLFVLELDQSRLIDDDFIPFVLALLEQLGQRKPLPHHLEPIIDVHELIVVYAVFGVPFNALACGLARVQGDDVVEEGLTGGGEFERFGGVGVVVVCGVSLPDFEVFAGEGGVGGQGCRGGLGHCERS